MLTLSAQAKVNLALDVTAKRSDGYHEIDSVMQSIALADQITLEPHNRIELTSNDNRLPADGQNLAWKAAELMQREAGTAIGVKIHITKNIPIAAGLAGGSADAAAVLLGLNQLWNLNLGNDELMRLGVKLGADVPFCIGKGTARARGIGEKLTGIKSRINCSLLLVTPNIQVSTAQAYNRLQLDQIKQRPRINRVIAALEEGNLPLLTESWGNVFEEFILKDFPAVAQVKEAFRRFGLSACLMSGSGPSVYALNPPPEAVKPFSASIPPDWFCCFTHFYLGEDKRD